MRGGRRKRNVVLTIEAMDFEAVFENEAHTLQVVLRIFERDAKQAQIKSLRTALRRARAAAQMTKYQADR